MCQMLVRGSSVHQPARLLVGKKTAPAGREPALAAVFGRALRHEIAFWNAFVPARGRRG